MSSALAQVQEINLIGQQNIWKPFVAATLSQNNTDLNIIVKTDNNGKLWNRAFFQTQINSPTNKSPILNLDYGSRSSWETQHSSQKLEVGQYQYTLEQFSE
jgi:hypothetical protein